jgi:hypothetical protein
MAKLYLGILALPLALPVLQMLLTGQNLQWIMPNILLYTSYRSTTQSWWFSTVQIDKSIKLPPSPIPEIDAANYTFDTLKRATSNFRYPGTRDPHATCV